MVLDLTAIEKIVLSDEPAFIAEARKQATKLALHVNGEGVKDALDKIEGFERDENLRKKHAKSNRDLFERLSRPLDKVWSAKGGSLYYNLPDSQEAAARGFAANVFPNVSIKAWLRSVWESHLKDDPCGVMFLEIMKAEDAPQALRDGVSIVYPTYKGTSVIHSYRLNGTKLEWVAFKLEAAYVKELGYVGDTDSAKFYRVVDDRADYIVKVRDKDAIVLDDLTINNLLGYVPAKLNSDLVDPTGKAPAISIFQPAMELADKLLVKNSIQTIHEFHHGFPKVAELASDCPVCEGTGQFEGKDCHACNGTGRKPSSKPNEVKMIGLPASKDEPMVLPRDAFAYLSPDKVYWEMAGADRHEIEGVMFAVVWGDESMARTGGTKTDGQKTATEIVADMAPKADRLHAVIEMAETRHKFILDAVVKLNLNLPTYSGAAVSYGRRLLIESPDTLWNKYSQAKKDGAPINVLDEHLNEYFESKYQADPLGLRIALQLMYVEPMVHYTIAEVRSFGVNPEMLQAKIYFSEWLSTTSEAQLAVQSITDLRESLYAYAASKAVAPAADPVQ